MTRRLRALMLMMAILCAASEALAVTASITEVKSKHESRLLSLPGVVSVGIGRASDGRTVIVIGVEGKAGVEGPDLPKQLEGYPVRVDVIGPVRAQ